jgi:hypothetical protein
MFEIYCILFADKFLKLNYEKEFPFSRFCSFIF